MLLLCQPRINVWEYVKEDDIFKMLSMTCKALAMEIEFWLKTKPHLDCSSRMEIFPKTTIFVLDFDFLFSKDSLIASRKFKAIKSFLGATENGKIVRHLEINSYSVDDYSCPYFLLSALWPCLKGLRNLEKVELVGAAEREDHDECKIQYFIPEIKKGPKVKYLSWHTAKPVKGENIREQNENLESIGVDDGRIGQESFNSFSAELDFLEEQIGSEKHCEVVLGG